MRLQVINTGFLMPICVTHAFKCVRLQVNILGFEMPRYITHVQQTSVVVNIISFEMLIYIYVYNLRFFPA